MTRRLGSRDLKRRKKRSDKGKRRKIYNGKMTKPKIKRNGRFVPYVSKRGKNDPIKIWFQEKKRMSKDGYNKWNKKARKYLDRTVKIFKDRPVLVKPEQINTPERIGEITIQCMQYPGLFNFMMPSGSKSRSGVSYKKKAIVRITETGEGLHAEVTNFSQMRHYRWFWKG